MCDSVWKVCLHSDSLIPIKRHASGPLTRKTDGNLFIGSYSIDWI